MYEIDFYENNVFTKEGDMKKWNFTCMVEARAWPTFDMDHILETDAKVQILATKLPHIRKMAYFTQ